MDSKLRCGGAVWIFPAGLKDWILAVGRYSSRGWTEFMQLVELLVKVVELSLNVVEKIKNPPK